MVSMMEKTKKTAREEEEDEGDEKRSLHIRRCSHAKVSSFVVRCVCTLYGVRCARLPSHRIQSSNSGFTEISFYFIYFLLHRVCAQQPKP